MHSPPPHACRHDAALASDDFRNDFAAFRRMGAAKPAIVQRLLAGRAPGAAVALSDVDVVWLRDPGPFLARHAAADVLISTDCLSHWVEARAADSRVRRRAGDAAVRPAHYHRCGHLPGATFGRAFNTGVIIFRNRCAHNKSSRMHGRYT